MKLASTAFEHEKPMPKKYTADGDDISPPLEWRDALDGSAAFVLLMEDPDAPNGVWLHWLIYDLPRGMTHLPEGVAPDSIVYSARQGTNSFGNCGYGGPAPPLPAEHRYVFTLLALDAATGLKPAASRQEVQDATEGHVLAIATLTGRYQREVKGH